ncbi:hypothetical protein Caka_0921 [Coraliomargarita akajimensis DSM 45221]|uniref:Uncharacterized protein n=1 Tax=Coraliomargarita akajimensis (strain DSM 45221 / IAM 15411 / JCM 23193 / KCTC 12865 / 04OKA010-24) TaxID=583355 RepID=D5EQV0_CORAD|nr:hypothetical protein Caka_0921 [Coraliomargarita akajimensis DSM 45221]
MELKPFFDLGDRKENQIANSQRVCRFQKGSKVGYVDLVAAIKCCTLIELKVDVADYAIASPTILPVVHAA